MLGERERMEAIHGIPCGHKSHSSGEENDRANLAVRASVLTDHLVRPEENGRGNRDAQFLRGLQVNGPRSWDRPLYARRGGLRGAGGSSTDSKIAANIE